MNRTLKIGLCSLTAVSTLGGCAFPKQIERFGVEYNTALSTMNNEQTLLNILRAKEGMPAHITSVSRFNGQLGVKAIASANGQLRGEGITSTQVDGNSRSNTTAPTGATIVDGATGSLTNVIAEGVDLYTPNVSGELTSGSSFEVAVFDSQKFYQGFLSAVPISTLENFINQGVDPQLVFQLLIGSVQFRAKDDGNGIKKGELIHTINNDVKNFEFVPGFLRCFNIYGEDFTPSATKIVPISRFTSGQKGGHITLDMEKFSTIDFEKFSLSSELGIPTDPEQDRNVYLEKPKPKARVMKLQKRTSCKSFEYPSSFSTSKTPPKERGLQINSIYSDTSSPSGLSVKITLPTSSDLFVSATDIDSTIHVTLRSPDAIIRYLGAYLRETGTDRTRHKIGDKQLFWVATGRSKKALVTAKFNGKMFSVENEDGSVRNMEVLSIVQQIVNLQKESGDRPVTIPVRAIPQ